jgi:murein DD-endopeptidase MepM/ murein hydrolase activator NlpD
LKKIAAIAFAAAFAVAPAAAQEKPPPPPYNKGGGRSVMLDNGRSLPRDVVYRFLPAMLPLTTAEVTSPYGLRPDPFGGGSIEMHPGTDFRAPIGTPVHASAAGTVTAANNEAGYGMMVEVQHAFGYITRYAHLSRVDVAVGQIVDRDDILGLVGDTGRSTGPHLYWQIIENGKAIDPVDFAVTAYAAYEALGQQPMPPAGTRQRNIHQR